MSLQNTLRIVRASALYDLVVTIGFAFPFSAPLLFGGLDALDRALGLAGTVPDPTNLFTVMFANLKGGLVTVWSLFRLASPSLAAGVADIGGRIFFALGMVAALLHGASPLVGVMLALEIVWAVVQGVVVVAALASRSRFEM